MNLYQIIQKPIITERSTILKEKFNQYVFQVHPDATKLEIKQAVQQLFKVQVNQVRTANFFGKMRRLSLGKPQGKRVDWKKAIVSIQKGQEIKIDQEGAGK